jgi:hypothetical protein
MIITEEKNSSGNKFYRSVKTTQSNLALCETKKVDDTTPSVVSNDVCYEDGKIVKSARRYRDGDEVYEKPETTKEEELKKNELSAIADYQNWYIATYCGSNAYYPMQTNYATQAYYPIKRKYKFDASAPEFVPSTYKYNS